MKDLRGRSSLLLGALAVAACSAGVGSENSGSTSQASIKASISSGGLPIQLTLDGSGVLVSTSTNGFGAGTTDGFFANLGTNGRTCNTCHVEADAWTITPEHAARLEPDDPLFTPKAGSDC